MTDQVKSEIDQKQSLAIDALLAAALTPDALENRYVVDNDTHDKAVVESDQEWRLCCTRVSSKCLQFVVGSSITLSALAFSLYQIARSDISATEKAPFFAILGSTLTLYVPSPAQALTGKK